MGINKVWSFVLSLLLIPMIGWAQDYVDVTVARMWRSNGRKRETRNLFSQIIPESFGVNRDNSYLCSVFTTKVDAEWDKIWF